MPIELSYPGGKRFAFTIFDDCDNSTIANTRPFYELLETLGMRTTKTVWSLTSADVHPDWQGSSTLEDPEYREFALELQSRGFEIASHGASMMSSPRDKTRLALEVFRETFGHYPRTYANHGSNRENLYWFERRFRFGLLGRLYAWKVTKNMYRSEGHLPDSPYFWGDLCRKHVEYVRGFTFPVPNLLSVHRNILYRDPDTEFVNFWFTASHGLQVQAFNRLLQPPMQDTLVREGGICILATHVGGGFVQNGEVNPETRRLLERLAKEDGCFVPVSTLLDYLRTQGFGRLIPETERRMLEWRWLVHAARRRDL